MTTSDRRLEIATANLEESHDGLVGVLADRLSRIGAGEQDRAASATALAASETFRASRDPGPGSTA